MDFNDLTIEEAVSTLDGMYTDDPETAHSIADDILLAVVDSEVADAYKRLVKRSRWWATA